MCWKSLITLEAFLLYCLILPFIWSGSSLSFQYIYYLLLCTAVAAPLNIILMKGGACIFAGSVLESTLGKMLPKWVVHYLLASTLWVLLALHSALLPMVAQDCSEQLRSFEQMC